MSIFYLTYIFVRNIFSIEGANGQYDILTMSNNIFNRTHKLRIAIIQPV